MAVVGTAYVRVKLITDKLESQLTGAVERSLKKADLDKVGQEAGERLGEQIAARIPESRIQRKIKDAIEDGIDTADKGLTIDPEVDSGTYTARINWLTRPRIQQILVRINKKSLTAVEEFIRRASGLRNISDQAEKLFRRLWDLDKTAPILGAVATGVLAISAALGSAVGWIGLAASQLATLTALALPLPALMLAGAANIGVLAMAFADAKEVLKDLGPGWTRLQDVVSGTFWKAAEDPIRNLSNRILPVLSGQLRGTATALGQFVGKFAETAASEDNLNRLVTILGKNTEGIKNAIPGIEAFTNGLFKLGEAGSRYLPRLGTWFTDLGKRFEAWVDRIVDSGDMFRWVEDGLQVLGTLKDMLGDITGIFGGLGRAAEAAGGGGIYTVAAALDRLNEAINSVAGQEALTKFFTATEEATTRIGDGIGALFGSIGDSMDFIEDVMVTASDAVASALGGIGKIIESSGFQSGLETLIGGFKSFIDTLVPMAPEIGEILGSVGKIAGDFLTNFGPVLAAAIEALAPVVSELADALQPVIEDLAGGLTNALKFLTPYIEDIAPKIGDFVSKFGTWIAIGGGVIAVTDKLGGALGKLSGLGKVGDAIAGVAKKFSPVLVKAIQVVFGVITKHPIIAAITLIVGGLTWFFTKTEAGQAIVAKAWEFIQKAIAGVVDWWTNTAQPLLAAGWDVIMQGVQAFSGWFTDHVMPVIESFGGLMEALWARLQPVIAAIAGSFELIGQGLKWVWDSVISPVLGWIGERFKAAWDQAKAAWDVVGPPLIAAISTAWENFKVVFGALWDTLKALVEGALANIKIVIDTVTAAINGDWTAVWDGIKAYFANVWETIKNVLSIGVNALSTILSNVWALIGGTVTSVWNGITAFFSGVWTTIRNLFTAAATGIQNFLSGVWNTIKTTATNIWNSIITYITGFPGRFLNGLSKLGQLGAKAAEWFGKFYTEAQKKFNDVVNFVKGIPGKVLGALGNIGSTLSSSGRSLIDGFIGGIRRGFDNAVSAVKGGLQRIRDFFPFSPAKVGPFSGKGYTTFSGEKLLRDFGVGITKGSVAAVNAGAAALQRVNGTFYTAQVAAAEQTYKVAQKAYSNATSKSKKNYKAAVDRAKAHLDAVKKTTAAAIKVDKELIASGEAVDKAFAAIVKRIQTAQLNIAKIMRTDYWSMTKGTVKQAGATLTRIVEELYKVNTPATKTLANYVNREKQVLTGMMATRESLRKNLTDANKRLTDLLDDQAKYISNLYQDTMDFSSAFEQKTADDMLATMRNQITATATFRKNLAELSKLGLSDTMLDMIAQSGIDAGNKSAEALLKGGVNAVKEMNALEKQLDKEAKSLSNTMGKQMYDAGIEAARGLIAGLKKQDSELTKAIEAMAVSIYANLKKVLQIKSPSRVMTRVGSDAAAGVPLGLLSQIRAIKDASKQLGEAAIPRKMWIEAPRLTDVNRRTAPALAGAGGGGGNLNVEHLQLNITADDLTDIPVLIDKLKAMSRNLKQGRTGEKR